MWSTCQQVKVWGWDGSDYSITGEWIQIQGVESILNWGTKLMKILSLKEVSILEKWLYIQRSTGEGFQSIHKKNLEFAWTDTWYVQMHKLKVEEFIVMFKLILRHVLRDFEHWKCVKMW